MLEKATPERLSKFSGGVLITVLVLELPSPEEPTYRAGNSRAFRRCWPNALH